MHFFFSVLIFVFLLLFYIHLQYQYKTSNDLEIYELDYTTNKQLQEICHLKQPVLFPFEFEIHLDLNLNLDLDLKEDVQVKDIWDYYKPNITSVDAISLSYSSAYGLMETDTKGHFFSENNFDLVREREQDLSKMNEYLASPWVLHKTYDILFGSKNTHTPFKYHTETARFLWITSSTSSSSSPLDFVRIKMTPWKNHKYLKTKKDYENYEFWSPIDIWRFPPENLKCLEFTVQIGVILFIPAYWFYSIEFTKPSISVVSFTYSTGMNMVSNIANYGLFFLQQNNIRNLGNWKNIKKVLTESVYEEKREKPEGNENENEEGQEEGDKNEEKEGDKNEEKIDKNEKEVQEMLSVITKN